MDAQRELYLQGPRNAILPNQGNCIKGENKVGASKQSMTDPRVEPLSKQQEQGFV